MSKKKIAVFASGNGSNFEAIVKACVEGTVDAEVVLCVTDRPGAYVTERAARAGVPMVEFRPKDYPSKRDFELMLMHHLEEKEVDLICLAGYMRIIGETLLEAYPGRILNIHPSLLPAFRGADAVGQALAYGVKVYGVTVHYVDATLDGGKIIAQAAISYEGNDRDDLEAMIHAREHILYPEAINRVLPTI
ncbi:MAG: phosphoribosylglycinamide formyltransferase [Muribaculaceae bacterium]|nr:phosphoribosylglycinamide formyltransferase [Muribaculaceae bacterium]